MTEIHTILQHELQGSVNFYRDHTNLDPHSAGYGLTLDATKNLSIASIAATGFTLSAWVIGAERGYFTRQFALETTRGTLRTLLHRVPHHRGFFAHFLDMNTAERWHTCEYSTIDTALCLNGVITACAYFEDDELWTLGNALLSRIDWNFLVFEQEGFTRFRMAYNPDHDGDYVQGEPGFISQWDMAAEQKMMYLQAAPFIDPALAQRLYHGFRRDTGTFDGHSIIINPGGTLFAYQFSEAWLDTASYLDPDGIDWFQNTRLATLANRAFCIEHAPRFRTYHANSWGVSAGDSPWGYDVSGATPALGTPQPNGTVSIYGAISSLPFVPDHVMAMIEYLYHEQPATWGKYGFFDSYNLAVDPAWYSTALYGIDKGCSMIMIENYLTGLIWNTYTESALIQKALAILGFQRRPAQKDTA
ncbi:MAG: glucoamylase family protein [bacterium]|nr:glucoamylase family protein [bacterium]